MLDARYDVLPPIGFQHRVTNRTLLGHIESALAHADEMVGVRARLELQDAVDSRDELDQVRDRAVARVVVELGVLAKPLELVENRVLRSLLPVVQKHVLPELREILVGLDAALVVDLRENLDVAGETKRRPRRFT